MGSATPGLVVLGCTGDQAEQAMRDKPVSTLPPWPLLQFLSKVPALVLYDDGLTIPWKCKPNKQQWKAEEDTLLEEIPNVWKGSQSPRAMGVRTAV